VAETTTQIVREAPEIEKFKRDLLASAETLVQKPVDLPAYQSAGLSGLQQAAVNLGTQYGTGGQGIGNYAPYLQGAGAALTGAGVGTGRAMNDLAALNVAPEFATAQQGMGAAAQTAGQLGNFAQIAGRGYGNIAQGSQTLGASGQAVGQGLQTAAGIAPYAQVMGQGYGDIARGGQTLGLGQMAAGRAFDVSENISPFADVMGQGYGNIAQGSQTLGMAGQALGGAAQMYNPAQGIGAFMNPYQQSVIDEAMKNINRQGDIARQGLAAQAVRTGAFGGTREGVQRAELERNLSDTRNSAIINALQQGYGQALQGSQQAFEAQQGRQFNVGQGLSNLGQMQAQQGLMGAQLAGQQANLYSQQAGLQGQLAGQIANIGQQQSQQGLMGAQLAGQQAGLLAQQAGLQGQLGGQLAGIGQAQSQQGILGSQIAQTQAGMLGQQAGLYENIAQGMGALAGQRANVELQRAGTMGQLAQGLGQLGSQQGNLAGQAQALAQGDLNTYLALGGLQQQAAQQTIDANRATQTQKAMMPYQQLGFLSDIYKGAPSSTSTLTQSTSPTVSPAMAAIGAGTAILGTAAGAKNAGLFG
jgi:hypothetical protein